MNWYQKILSCLLWLRLVRLAYVVSEQWAKSDRMFKAEAAFDLQCHLIKYYGYHECPHCHWATRREDEHIHSPRHPCATAHQMQQLEAVVRDAILKVYSGRDVSQPGHTKPDQTIH